MIFSNATKKDALNMHQEEYDFHGFKDDWRYSLRMGGCLYEAARWVYDESSFHRTSRLTYTDDTLFMDDPFNPLDGTDIFGAHSKANIHGTNLVASTATDIPTALKAEADALADYTAYETNWEATACAINTPSNATCSDHVVELARLWMEMNFCLYQTVNNTTTCSSDITAYRNYRETHLYTSDAVDGSGGSGCTINPPVDVNNSCCNPQWWGCPGGDCQCCYNYTIPAYPSVHCGHTTSPPTQTHGIEKSMYSVINTYLGMFSKIIMVIID